MIACSVICLFVLFFALYKPSYAILDYETIVVKTLFGRTKIKNRWDNIRNIDLQATDVMHYRQYSRICICFSYEGCPKWLSGNPALLRKNRVEVLPTRKNLAILREYIKNYMDYGDILIKPPEWH